MRSASSFRSYTTFAYRWEAVLSTTTSFGEMTTPAPISKHAELAEKIISRQIGASSPAVSPDGKYLAYVVTRIDYKVNKYRSQVWLTATDGSTAPRPLTAGEKRDGNPNWSPDGTWL